MQYPEFSLLCIAYRYLKTNDAKLSAITSSKTVRQCGFFLDLDDNIYMNTCNKLQSSYI